MPRDFILQLLHIFTIRMFLLYYVQLVILYKFLFYYYLLLYVFMISNWHLRLMTSLLNAVDNILLQYFNYIYLLQ